MLGDIENPRWLYFKAILFLLTGLIASAVLLLDSPSVRTALLLAAAIWGFCRAYYFAFYVVEKYVDPSFKFAGLIAFTRYVLGSKRRVGGTSTEPAVAEAPHGVPPSEEK
jgi:hypothetical protein